MPEDRHPHPHGPPWSGGPPWGGGPWGRGRPPWWPEGEDWPPRGPEAWRGMRRHFVRKFVVVLAVFVAAIVGLSALVGGFIFRGGEPRGQFLPIGIVVVVLVVLLVVRAGRRFAAPVVDVMEAADRVAGGDYEARVEARGPREVQRL